VFVACDRRHNEIQIVTKNPVGARLADAGQPGFALDQLVKQALALIVESVDSGHHRCERWLRQGVSLQLISARPIEMPAPIPAAKAPAP